MPISTSKKKALILTVYYLRIKLMLLIDTMIIGRQELLNII